MQEPTWNELLKKERESRLLTQAQVAEEIGTDARVVRSWELGESFPGKHFRRKICDFYEKKPEELKLHEESAIKVRQERHLGPKIIIPRDLEPDPIEEDAAVEVSTAFAEASTDRIAAVNPPVNDDTLHGPDTYPYSPHTLLPPPPPSRPPVMSYLKIGLACLIIGIFIGGTLLWFSGYLPAKIGSLSLPSSPSLSESRTSSTATTRANPSKTATARPSRTVNPLPGGQTQPPSTKPTATATQAPKPSPTTPPPPSSGIFFGFNGSTNGWGTSEGSYKSASTSVTSSPVYSGSGSLQVTSALIGTGSSSYPGDGVYTHTETVGYFNAQNFRGATASCYIYLPPGIAPGGTNPGYIRIFAKDSNSRNDFGGSGVGLSSTGYWIHLSFVIDAVPGDADPGFDPTRVSALGIRVDLYNGATLDYNGPFYVDACSIS